MTREEAKELFEDNFTVINTHGHYTKEEEGQAQELAISALKPTCKIEESNFSMEQYRADMQSAYDCGKAEALKGFEGMTNGEVMKAVFPNCYMGIDDDEWIVTNIDGRTMFQPEWWNAPYQKGGE